MFPTPRARFCLQVSACACGVGRQRRYPFEFPQPADSRNRSPGFVPRPWKILRLELRLRRGLALEVLLFRSLFRNTRYEVSEGRAVFGDSKLLWLGAMAFHWSMLMILLRHLRLFIEPVPAFVLMLQRVDGFFQIGVPELYLSDRRVSLPASLSPVATLPRSAGSLHFSGSPITLLFFCCLESPLPAC